MHRDSFSFIAPYLSSPLPLQRLHQKVILIHFLIFILSSSSLSSKQKHLPTSKKKSPRHVMRKISFIMSDAKINHDMTWRRSGDICAEKKYRKESMSGKNQFYLHLIPQIACLQACKTDFHKSTAVNTALKQIACYYDKAVFTINASHPAETSSQAPKHMCN